MAENGVIGRDNRLPWRLPDDMRHFRTLTLGQTVIMGRKTFESLDGPLSGRRNIVLSRNPDYRPAGVTVASSLDEALGLCSDKEVFVVGGSQIYECAIPRADRIYLTLIHETIDGDVHFPPIDPHEWELVERVDHPKDDEHAHSFSFLTYLRKDRPSSDDLSDHATPKKSIA